MSKSFWIILGLILSLFVGLIIVSGDKSEDTQQVNSEILTLGEGDYIEGNPDAKVTIIEYSDFQCPGCGFFFSIAEAAQQQFGDQIAFAMRNFPITSIHPNSMAAHRAAEAAGLQGKHGEMHDLLFSRQSSWSNSSNAIGIFEGYATELGLDIDQYKADTASQEVFDAINADLDSGKALGVNSTPTIFVNGKALDSIPSTPEAFASIIQAELDAANEVPAESS